MSTSATDMLRVDIARLASTGAWLSRQSDDIAETLWRRANAMSPADADLYSEKIRADILHLAWEDEIALTDAELDAAVAETVESLRALAEDARADRINSGTQSQWLRDRNRMEEV